MKHIKLTQGAYALVDDSDYEELNKHKWQLHKCGKWSYAERGTTNKIILMHRQIMGATKGTLIDHIDGDGLNNTRSNMRFVTNSQNQFNQSKSGRNTSGYRGVWLDKRRGTWEASVRANGKRIYLGNFPTPELAHEAYLAKAIEVAGEYLNPNA